MAGFYALLVLLAGFQGLVVRGQRPCSEPVPFSNPELADKSNELYGGLSEEEYTQIIDYLHNVSGLRITPPHSEVHNHTSNTIHAIEELPPSKSEALVYLDNDGPVPVRKAHVIVYHFAEQQVKEYAVYPIPNPTSHEEVYVNGDKDKPIAWNSRPINDHIEGPLVYEVQNATLFEIYDVIRKSFVPFDGCEELEPCVEFSMLPRVSHATGKRNVYIYYYLGNTLFEDYYLYSLPFNMVMEEADDGESYSLYKLYYNGFSFKTAQELNDKYRSDPSIRFTAPDLDKHRSGFGSPRYVDDGLKADQERRQPIEFYPDGPRYTVEGTHVEYMDWSFNFQPRVLTGMQIFDVRFKGERIAYELSLQDIVVFYTGGPPDDFFKSYFDNGFGTGRMSMPLIRGRDCPGGADYYNATLYAIGYDASYTQDDVICIFETRNSVPLRRHFSGNPATGGHRFAFSLPDNVLVIRQILTVWNYDYIVDYEFHQNGVVEAKISSTGYIQVANTLSDRHGIRHGYLLNEDWNIYGLLHQHLFNFKLDLDIAGRENRFKTLDMKTQMSNTEYAKDGASWYVPVMEENVVKTEQEAKVKYMFNQPKQYLICNANKKTKTGGHDRGYRISSNGFHNTLLQGSPLVATGASWSNYQLAVSKQKDNEQGTASYFIQANPFTPTKHFEDFFADNESIVDEDLVVWVSMGMHHAPTFEDLPVTATSGKVLSVAMYPFNYNSRDPSTSARDIGVFSDTTLFGHPAQDLLVVNDTCVH